MTLKKDIQVRVDRILEGRAEPRDLERIFDWLRFRSHGYETVQDIGDFAGHLEDRTKGVAFRGMRLFEDMLLYKIPQITSYNSGSPARTDLDTFRAGTAAVLKLLDAETVKKRTGLRKDRAEVTLQRALSKFTYYDGVTHRLRSPLTDAEAKVLQTSDSYIIGRAAMTSKELISDFAKCLFKNGLIAKEDEPFLLAEEDYVAAFAIEKMHLAKVALPSGRGTILRTFISEPYTSRTLAITASVHIPWEGSEMEMAQAIFTTDNKADEWCSPLILSGHLWDQPLELRVDRKLYPLS